jgi:6-phosphogluconolactonase
MAQQFYLAEPSAAHHVYVGAVHDGHPAIFRLTMDAGSGRLQSPGAAGAPELVVAVPEDAGMGGPWIAVHPSGSHVFASIRDGGPDPAQNRVEGFSVDPMSGALTSQGSESTVMPGSPHGVVDPSGSMLVASVMSGGVCGFALSPDGKLSGPPQSIIELEGGGSNVCRLRIAPAQTANQGHSAQLTMDGRVVVPDVGADKIWTFDLDPATATLEHAAVPSWTAPPGSGPRHFAAHPGGRWVYLILEMSCTIVALDYDSETGGMKEINTVSTLPADWAESGNGCRNTYSPSEGWLPETPVSDSAPYPQSVTTADIHVSPDGQYVYGTNRITEGEGSIAIFAVNSDTGALTLAGHCPSGGLVPRNMKIHPSGDYALVANQNSGNIVVFSVDKSTGQLTQRQAVDGLTAPLCLQFVPAAGGSSL